MPSQEDYLDNLLRDIAEKSEEPSERLPEEESGDFLTDPDMPGDAEELRFEPPDEAENLLAGLDGGENPSLGLDEAENLLAGLDGGENPSLGLDEAEGLLAGLDGGENPSLGLDEAENLLAGLDGGENPSLGLDEAENLLAGLDGGENPSLGLDEAENLLAGLDGGENPSLGLDEAENLLAGLDGGENPSLGLDEAENLLAGLDGGENPSLDLDAVSGMTEEEIEGLLASDEEPAENDFLQSFDMELSDEDVLKMLEDSDDDDLQEIQELLEKSDHDELIDDGNEISAGELFFGDDGNADDARKKEPPVRERKKTGREERRALAAAKREEKKAAKEAAKLKKAAEKMGKGAAKADKATRDAVARAPVAVQEELTDMSLLDSILSEAEAAKEDAALRKATQEEPAEFFDIDAEAGEVEELTAFPEQEGDAMESETPGEESAPEAEEDGFALDIDGLFQDVDGEGDSVFSDDMMELDLEEADKLIPDRDGGTGVGGSQEKKSLLTKIKDFLMEDDEENEDLRLSQENQNILNDLRNEAGGGNKKAKKGGKTAKAKSKKEAKPKKAKPKKPSKPKKERKQKEETNGSEKKLSFKKVLPVFLIGVSLGVLLFVFVHAASEYTDRKNARTAYYQGDYETCYQNLFGKKLDETESIMYGKSESILYIRLWIREYELYAQSGLELEALDSLIQTVARYPELYEYANRWNAGPEVSAGYAAILNVLESKYGLSESQTLEIASQRSDKVYTRMVTDIVEGKSLASWNASETPVTPETPVSEEDSMSDLLPEEEELGGDTFIENP